MRCLIAALMILSTISAARAERIRFCFLFCAIESTAAVDGFCQNYERVIRNAEDAGAIKNLSRAPKSRISRNDVLYRCTCEAWQNPICAGLGTPK